MNPTPVETSEEIEIAASHWAIKDRPLSADDEAALRAWLAGDARRRGALLRAQATWATLSRAKALGVQATRAAANSNRRPDTTRRGLLTASVAAGGFMLAGAVGLVVTHKQEAVTETGEIRRLPMSDGSIATINTDSKIKIAMTDRRREVDLVQGEVWFKVAKNKERPFVVMAGLARVQAVGTAFSVRRLGDGAEVLVTEGTVKVWADGAAQPPVYLNAGDRTIVGQKSEVKVEYAPQAVDSTLAWRSGQIDLSGQSLSAAAAEFNRYNTKKIIIEDPELGNERLLGRMSTDDPEGFSKAVALAFGTEVTQEDNKIYIGVKKK